MDVLKKIIKESKESNKTLLKDINYTYKDFYKDKEKFLHFLKKINKKSVIAVCANYSPHFLSLIFATYESGNILTFINASASYYEKNYIIKNSSACLVFFDRDTIIEGKNYSQFMNYKVLKRNVNLNFFKKDDNFIIYTSGTTSKPKGVILTNKAISSNVLAISKDLGLNSKYISIIFSPPGYAMALSQIITYMFNEMSFVLNSNGLKFPTAIINKIKKHKVNLLNISVSAFRILKSYLDHNKTKFKNIKIIMSGGMHMTDDIILQYKRYFPKSEIINFYGCTENSPRISHFHIKKFKRDFYNNWPVGKSLNGVKIKVLKNKNKKIGKILISGSSLMRGYLKKPILTKKKIRNGWFDTGDLGYFNEKNFLILVGREDNSFRVGHEKLCPEEIEPIIKKKLNLQEAVVAKKKNSITDWEPVLAIKKRKNNLNVLKLKIILSKYLSNFKIPKGIHYFKQIPKTTYGKIDRKEINRLVNS